jgi:hypothetical protein
MATSLQVNDILSFRAWSSLSEQAAVNTYNYEVVSVTGGGITDQDVTNPLEVSMAGFYNSIQPSSVLWDGLQCYFMRRSGPLPAPVSSVVSAGPGTAGTIPMPKNGAPILKYSTFTRGPGGRGRLYLPFVDSGFLTALGLPNATLNGLINAWCTALLTPLVRTIGANSATLVWGLLTKGVGPAPPTIKQILTAASADRIGQMHKRGDYGRANASPV